MRIPRSFLAALLTTIAATVCLPPAAGAAGPRAAYVTNVNGGGVFPFDASAGAFGTPIALGGFLWGVAIAPDGATAWVADGSSSVVPIDTATNTAGTPIPVGNSPRVIGITPDGARAYVANIGSNTVTPIDLATRTAAVPIAVGSSPHGIAITPDGETVYATSQGGSDVITIDTATNTAGPSIPVGAGTYGIAISPDGATVYVSRLFTSSVIPIDTATNTAGPPIAIGILPEGIAITPDGATAYVTDVGADAVWTLDLSSGTVGPPTAVGQDPTTAAIAPDRAPTAAFAASVEDHEVTLDASAASDPDGSVVAYAWDFGDGETATGAQPVVRHTYTQPGRFAVTLTVTDDEGCSEALVFTGQTAFCAASPEARAEHAVTVAAPPAPPTPEPPGSPAPPVVPGPLTVPLPPGSPPALRQAIERFTLDGPCVRRARDGRARIGLRLRLALPGSISIQVDRALIAVDGERCPARDPNRRFAGRLRRVTTIGDVPTQAVAASVRRRVTRSFELPPGLYRVGVRAHGPNRSLPRPAYRWVRVLDEPR